MKKTYINPDIKVVSINTSCQMLAESNLRYQGDYDSEKVTMGSRRADLWDDEDF